MKTKIFFVMGVSGSGKSTVGTLLAEKLGIPFFDGDDFHPEVNILKMKSGNPLNDEDRKEWLERLNLLAKENEKNGAVIACSALKKRYREVLTEQIQEISTFVYLQGSFEEIRTRMAKREDHFMPNELLQSQFDTLEAPRAAITISILKRPNEQVEQILTKLRC